MKTWSKNIVNLRGKLLIALLAGVLGGVVATSISSLVFPQGLVGDDRKAETKLAEASAESCMCVDSRPFQFDLGNAVCLLDN
jgi:hypothetical protein